MAVLRTRARGANAGKQRLRKKQRPYIYSEKRIQTSHGNRYCLEKVNSPDYNANSPAAGKVVLCVEDEEPQLRWRMSVLELAGFVAVGARDGAEALELFKSRPFDAVLLDHWMPGLKGTEIAKKMREINPDVPILIISGLGYLPGESSLVNAWLPKGHIQPKELIREVERQIGLHGTRSPKNATTGAKGSKLPSS